MGVHGDGTDSFIKMDIFLNHRYMKRKPRMK